MSLDAHQLKFASDFAADVEQLRLSLQRCVGVDRLGGANGWIMAGLWLLKSPDSSASTVAAAIPRATGFSVETCVEAMANLGFYAAGPRAAHAHYTTKDLPLLLVDSEQRLSLIFQDRDSTTCWQAHDDGTVTPVENGMLALRGAAAIYSFRKGRQDISLAKSWREHRDAGWFRALLGKFPGMGTAVLALSLAIALVSLLYPVLTIQIYVQVIGLGSLATLPMMALGLVLVVLLEFAALRLRGNAVGWLAARMEYLVGVESLRQMLRLKPGVIERAAVTDQVARIRSFENVREFITGPMFTSILDLPMTIAGVAAIAVIAPQVLPVMLTTCLVFAGLLFLLLRTNRVLVRMVADEATAMQAATIETFEKRTALRQTGLIDTWLSRLARLVRREQKALFRLRLASGAAEAAATLVLNTGIAFAVAAGTVAIWQGELTPQAFLAVIIVFVRATLPLLVMCLSVQRAEQLRNSVRQINALFELEAEERAERPRRHRREFDGTIDFINVGFRATDTRPVFVGLDLHIAPGSIIAVTGATGSGKSTLLRLVQGATEISLGNLRIGGIDLRQFPSDELRANVSYVSQSPHLLPGTLADNLRLAQPDADLASLKQVARLVGLDARIDIENGGLDLDFDVEARARVSLEFRLQLALAQAVLSDNHIILIDDIPNELLDGRIGELLRMLIQRSRGSRTLFLVTTRSDFITLADRVIALRYGGVPRVIEPNRFLERAA